MMQRQTFYFMADDGLGGSSGGAATSVPAGDTDPILEEPGYLADPGEFEPDPGSEAAAGAQDDPWAGVPDAIRAAAEAKGLKTPEDFARSFQEAQSLIGRRDEAALQAQQERDALAARLQELTAGAGQQAADQGDQSWTVDFEALSAAAQDDPIQAMKLYHENVVPQLLQDFGTHLLQAVDQQVGQKIAPIQQHTSQTMLRDQSSDLVRTFGADTVAKHKEELVRLVAARPEYRDSPRGLAMAMNELVALEAARERAASFGNEAETLAGGRNPRGGANRPPRDVAAETRAAIEAAMPGLGGKDGLS